MQILFSLVISFLVFLFFLKFRGFQNIGFDKISLTLSYVFFIVLSFFAVLFSGFFENFLLLKAKPFLVNFDEYLLRASHTLIVSICEELIKFFLFFILYIFLERKYLKVDFSNSEDFRKTRFFVQNISFVFGLFFASFENVLYLIEGSVSFVDRFFTATILHVGLALFYEKIIFEKKTVLLFLICLHFIYNFSGYYNLLFWTFGFVILFVCVRKIVYFFKKY